jgi:Methyltransferase domain
MDPSQNLTAVSTFVTRESCGGPVILRANGRPRVHAFCDRDECRRAASAARVRASRAGKKLRPLDPPMPNHVRTVQGNNSALIAAVARLYLPDAAIVADVTWGYGVFWQRFNGSRQFTLFGSDMRQEYPEKIPQKPADLIADFRQLPYADESIDVVVLDPPYTHCGHYINNYKYNSKLTDHMRHPEVIGLYHAGMREAHRVLRPGGTLWVKCKDEIDSGQCWSHIELYQIAQKLGLRAADLFVLASRPAPTRRHLRQHHALKTHSYLWILRKPRSSMRRLTK